MKRKSALSILVAIVLMLTFVSANAETNAKTLLKSIDKLAQKGWTINASYTVGSDTIDVIENDIGKADSSGYIASAKGTYYTFTKAKIVAGVNKANRFSNCALLIPG